MKWTAEGIKERLNEAMMSESGDALTAKRIVRAAHDLFVEHGYKKTTMSAIARAAGVAKATLYLHAESKAELLYRSIALEKSESASEWLQVFDQQRPIETRLQNYIEMLISLGQDSPLMHRYRQGDLELIHALEEYKPEQRARDGQNSIEFHLQLLEELSQGRLCDAEKNDFAHVLSALALLAGPLSNPKLQKHFDNEILAKTLSKLLVAGLIAQVPPSGSGPQGAAQ